MDEQRGSEQPREQPQERPQSQSHGEPEEQARQPQPLEGEPEPLPPQSLRGAHLARALTATGGFVDAVGYIALFHLFIAHQSGNSVGLGAALATGTWTIAWRRFSAIGAFVFGIFLGTVIVEQCIARGRARWSGVVVAVAELVGLATALVVGTVRTVHGVLVPAETASFAAAATSLAWAMGLQNVILRRVGSDRTPTTYVTGILTEATELFGIGLHQRRDRGRRATLRRSGFLGSLWLLYLGGAVAGAAAQEAWGFGALGVPMAVVVGVIVWQARLGFQPSLVPPSQLRGPEERQSSKGGAPGREGESEGESEGEGDSGLQTSGQG